MVSTDARHHAARALLVSVHCTTVYPTGKTQHCCVPPGHRSAPIALGLFGDADEEAEQDGFADAIQDGALQQVGLYTRPPSICCVFSCIPVAVPASVHAELNVHTIPCPVQLFSILCTLRFMGGEGTLLLMVRISSNRVESS